ncbi:hypothetical protein F2Q65_14800 [Thiohalocapsa marina]|uniref:WGR domain-containing protein n=1 Tax=Thiohalocapsa marina TaxID=424902 RepID=A0A5M8FJ01_9GAMM|nr:hypothetical protein [Thiohalocapsa marina]KAA6183706.1 hypothetical protein F2Q65_14800 [Thiohalocapsa marina]
MSAEAPRWTLYRFTHADGSAKDWAWRRLPTGGVEVAWGRSGTRAQRRVYPPREGPLIERRALQKQHKGYRLLGDAVLHEGVLQPFVRPQDASSRQQTPHFSAAANAPPTTPLPPVDLSGIAAGRDDFWF